MQIVYELSVSNCHALAAAAPALPALLCRLIAAHTPLLAASPPSFPSTSPSLSSASLSSSSSALEGVDASNELLLRAAAVTVAEAVVATALDVLARWPAPALLRCACGFYSLSLHISSSIWPSIFTYMHSTDSMFLLFGF